MCTTTQACKGVGVAFATSCNVASTSLSFPLQAPDHYVWIPLRLLVCALICVFVSQPGLPLCHQSQSGKLRHTCASAPTVCFHYLIWTCICLGMMLVKTVHHLRMTCYASYDGMLICMLARMCIAHFRRTPEIGS